MALFSNRMIDARLAGHSWDDIDNFLTTSADTAAAEGYGEEEIDNFLGRSRLDPNQATADWKNRLAHDDALASAISAVKPMPVSPLEGMSADRLAAYAAIPKPEIITPEDGQAELAPSGISLNDQLMRSAYARSLAGDAARTPLDFAERYTAGIPGVDAGSLVRAAGELGASLPSDRDFTDQAIAIAHSSGVALTPPPRSSPEENLEKNQPFLKEGAGDFETKLEPEEEAKFRQWVQDNDVRFDPDEGGPQDYDMRGFYRGLMNGDPHAKTGMNDNDGKLHFNDWWKTPYHHSFSAESQWANPETAPDWNEQDQLVTPDGQVVFDERADSRGVNIVRNNLIDHWRETGEDLRDIYKQAWSDPVFAEKLSTPPDTSLHQLAQVFPDANHGFLRSMRDIGFGVGAGMGNIGGEILRWGNHILPDELTTAIRDGYNGLVKAGLPLVPVPEGGLEVMKRERIEALKAAGSNEEDWSQWAGQVIATLPMFTTFGLGGLWGWVAGGATSGLAMGAFEPDKSEDFWASKAKAMTEGTLHGAAFGGALFGIGKAVSKMAPEAARMLGRVVAKMEEPRVEVLDLDAAAGTAAKELPASEALAPPKIAERPPVEPPVEGAAPKEPPSKLDFVPEAQPAEKLEAIAKDWVEGHPEVKAEVRARNGGELPKETDPEFFEKLAAGQDPATIDLARGHDTAKGLIDHVVDTFKDLMTNEEGTLKLWKTSEQKAADRTRKDANLTVQHSILAAEGGSKRALAYAEHLLDPSSGRLGALVPSGMRSAYLAGKLDNAFARVQPHMKEWEAELDKGINGNPMGTKVGQLLQYMEGQSAGVTLPANHPLAPVAKSMRDVFTFFRKEMEDMDAAGQIDMKHFFDDYFPHMWKDPNAARTVVDRAFSPTGKTGSGSALQKRKYLTFEDGLIAGLEPAERDPLKMVMGYADRVGKYLASRKVLADNTRTKANPDGVLYWATHATDPLNDIELKGGGQHRAIAMEKPLKFREGEARAREQLRQATAAGAPQATIDVYKAAVAAATKAAEPTAMVQKLYANRGAANAWNNWVDNGFTSSPKLANWQEKLMFTKNGMTQLALLNPAFHGMGVAIEAAGGGVGNAISELARGEIIRGTKDLVMGASVIPEITKKFIEGGKVIEKFNTMHPDQAIRWLNEGGFQFGPRPLIYRTGKAPGYLESLTRHELKSDWVNSLNRIVEKDANGETSLGTAAWRSTEMVGREVGRTMNAISSPMFDHWIPRLKAAAAYERMQTYMRQNPKATDDMLRAKAREIAKNTDDRLGEMNQDSLFWPRWVKQTSQVMMLSPTWLFGALRFMATSVGAAGNLTANLTKLATTGQMGTRYVNETALTTMAGFAGITTGINTLYQYFMTGGPGGEGKFPWQTDTPFHDFVSPRTGGTNPKTGMPERGMVPGLIKEFYDLARVGMITAVNPWDLGEAIAHYGMNRLSPPPQLMRAFFTGEDPIGHYVTAGGKFPEFAEQHVRPIFTGTILNRQRGTGIPEWQNWLGFRATMPHVEDPKGFMEARHRMEMRHLMDDYKRQVRENRYLETPKELPELPAEARTTGRGRKPRSSAASEILLQKYESRRR